MVKKSIPEIMSILGNTSTSSNAAKELVANIDTADVTKEEQEKIPTLFKTNFPHAFSEL